MGPGYSVKKTHELEYVTQPPVRFKVSSSNGTRQCEAQDFLRDRWSIAERQRCALNMSSRQPKVTVRTELPVEACRWTRQDRSD